MKYMVMIVYCSVGLNSAISTNAGGSNSKRMIL